MIRFAKIFLATVESNTNNLCTKFNNVQYVAFVRFSFPSFLLPVFKATLKEWELQIKARMSVKITHLDVQRNWTHKSEIQACLGTVSRSSIKHLYQYT